MQRLLRRSILALALLAAAPSLAAQAAPDEADLRAKHAEKLKKEFAGKIPWVQTYAEALAKGKAEGKLVLGYFTRSYAPCPPCNALEASALLEGWWVDAAKEFVPYLHVTTGIESMPDETLLVEKGGNSFPTMLFLEPATGAVLGARWVPVDAQTVRDELAKATAEAAGLQQLLRDAAAKPDDQTVQATLKLKLALMHAAPAPLAELAELAKAPGLDPELKARFDGWYAVQRFQQAMREVEAKQPQTRNEHADLIEVALYGLLKEGVRLPHDDESAEFFYDFGLNGAVKQGDRAVAEAAYAGYEKVLQRVAGLAPQHEAEVKKALEEAKARLKRLDEKPEDP